MDTGRCLKTRKATSAMMETLCNGIDFDLLYFFHITDRFRVYYVELRYPVH